jgi:hypothetical protein
VPCPSHDLSHSKQRRGLTTGWACSFGSPDVSAGARQLTPSRADYSDLGGDHADANAQQILWNQRIGNSATRMLRLSLRLSTYLLAGASAIYSGTVTTSWSHASTVRWAAPVEFQKSSQVEEHEHGVFASLNLCGAHALFELVGVLACLEFGYRTSGRNPLTEQSIAKTFRLSRLDIQPKVSAILFNQSHGSCRCNRVPTRRIRTARQIILRLRRFHPLSAVKNWW